MAGSAGSFVYSPMFPSRPCLTEILAAGVAADADSVFFTPVLEQAGVAGLAILFAVTRKMKFTTLLNKPIAVE